MFHFWVFGKWTHQLGAEKEGLREPRGVARMERGIEKREGQFSFLLSMAFFFFVFPFGFAYFSFQRLTIC